MKKILFGAKNLSSQKKPKQQEKMVRYFLPFASIAHGMLR